jgi:hypothetical protein
MGIYTIAKVVRDSMHGIITLLVEEGLRYYYVLNSWKCEINWSNCTRTMPPKSTVLKQGY